MHSLTGSMWMKVIFVQNYAAIVTKKEDKKEDTTRSRSFMFFSHAIAYASAMGKEIDLIIPENG